LEGLGDFRAYSADNLHIGAVNNNIISEAPSVILKTLSSVSTLNSLKVGKGNMM
jgi:hypothetical protein